MITVFIHTYSHTSPQTQTDRHIYRERGARSEIERGGEREREGGGHAHIEKHNHKPRDTRTQTQTHAHTRSHTSQLLRKKNVVSIIIETGK